MDYQEAQEVLRKQEDAKALLERYRKVETAHKELGFATRKELIEALREIDSPRGRRTPARRTAGRGRKPGKKAGRARLTPEARRKLEEAIRAGKSASELSGEFGISKPYVYVLKSQIKAKGAVRAAAPKKKGGKKKPSPVKKGAKAQKK